MLLIALGCTREITNPTEQTGPNILSRFAIDQYPTKLEGWSDSKLYWTSGGRYLEINSDDSLFTYRSSSSCFRQGRYQQLENGFRFFDYALHDSITLTQYYSTSDDSAYTLFLCGPACADTFVSTYYRERQGQYSMSPPGVSLNK